MKAILLTPMFTHLDELHVQQTVVNINDFRDIAPLLDCRMFCSAGYPERTVSALVDDEGLLTLDDSTLFLVVPWHPQPMAGSMLLQGFDPGSGENMDIDMDLAQPHIDQIYAADLPMVRMIAQRNEL